MTEEEKRKNAENDPLIRMRGNLQEEIASRIEEKVAGIIEDAFARAREAKEMDYEEYREAKRR